MEHQPVSRFLCLPVEIRLAIYELLGPCGRTTHLRARVRTRLTYPESYKCGADTKKEPPLVSHTYQHKPDEVSSLQVTLALLRLHRVCHNEVAPLLYGRNGFLARSFTMSKPGTVASGLGMSLGFASSTFGANIVLARLMPREPRRPLSEVLSRL